MPTQLYEVPGMHGVGWSIGTPEVQSDVDYGQKPGFGIRDLVDPPKTHDPERPSTFFF